MSIVNKTGAPWRAVVRTEQLEDGRRYDVLECKHREAHDYIAKKRRCRTCKDPSFSGINMEPRQHVAVVSVESQERGTPRPPLELPPFLKVEEVAALLRVNHKTVYTALLRGEIPGARRVGRVVRVSSRILLDWFDPIRQR
jgi:excisionase family DNA binding protein